MMKASIVIPTYNRAEFLDTALQSALSQEYENLEIIVCDDCSSDNTQEIVQKYLYDTRVTYSRNKQNRGQALNYFHVIKELASGDWVFVLCDDDYFSTTKYIQTIMQLTQDKEIDIVLTNTQIDWGHFTTQSHFDIHNSFTQEKYTKELLVDIWKMYPEVLDSATCFKRKIFLDGFAAGDTTSAMRLIEDFDIKMMQKRVAYSHEVSYVYTVDEHSLNKFKVDVYEFITLLKSFIKPISYALAEGLFTKQELQKIYLTKWNYYSRCTTFVSSVLDKEILQFVSYVIDFANTKDIFVLIEQKAKEYAKLYQNDVDIKIAEFKKIRDIYANKDAKINQAKSVIIYGTKAMAQDMKHFLEKKGVTIICFIDDFSQLQTFENISVHRSHMLPMFNADLYLIASANYTYIADMYASLLSNGVAKEKIVA